MDDFTVAIYCYIDDFLKFSTHKSKNKKRKMSDAEVITTAIVAAQYFGGNYTPALSYMVSYHGVQALDKSNFSRCLNRLHDEIEAFFLELGEFTKQTSKNKVFLIDSFPVPVCHNIRIKRSKIVQGEAYRGKCASKREYFYGFKVHLITNEAGNPVDMYVVKGSYHDSTALQSFSINLPTHSIIVADSGYTDYLEEDHYKEFENISLEVVRKKNSQRGDNLYNRIFKKVTRHQIESTFSSITRTFSRKIHAITKQGFVVKVALSVIAYAFEKLM